MYVDEHGKGKGPKEGKFSGISFLWEKGVCRLKELETPGQVKDEYTGQQIYRRKIISGSSLQNFLYLGSSVAVLGAAGPYLPYALCGKLVKICV